MIKSMTGYGRAQMLAGGFDITVEVKSVNHRYYEFSARVPRAYGFLEEKLKAFFQCHISRGKVDTYVSIDSVDDVAADVQVNDALASGYIQTLRQMSEKYGLRNDISVSFISRFPEVLTVRKEQKDEEKIWECVSVVAGDALKSFMEMRVAEGERMQRDRKSVV